MRTLATSWTGTPAQNMFALSHHFLSLEERDTAHGYSNYCVTVQGCSTKPSEHHNLGPGRWAEGHIFIPFFHETNHLQSLLLDLFISSRI